MDRCCRACRAVTDHRPFSTVCTIHIILGWDYLVIRPSDWVMGPIIGAVFTYFLLA